MLHAANYKQQYVIWQMQFMVDLDLNSQFQLPRGKVCVLAPFNMFLKPIWPRFNAPSQPNWTFDGHAWYIGKMGRDHSSLVILFYTF